MLLTETSSPAVLAQLGDEFKLKPFIPPRVVTHGDLQTLAAYFWPGRFRPRDLTGDEVRMFQVEKDTQVLARCRWQPNRTERGTIVMWHGIEGSSSSAYMLATAEKAYRAGMNVVRMNIRNCGGTEHLTPTLYHGGLTHDVRAMIEELIDQDRLPRIFLVGFSLGGNMVLKLAGEYGDDPPSQLAGVATISPSVNLRASCELIMTRRNFIYHKEFLHNLKRRIRNKAKLFPGRYDSSGLRHIKSLRQFDDTYIAPAFGFADADDYYKQASSLPYIPRIRVPTLIIHAQDDPFVPFEPLRDSSIAANPNVLLLAPERGGHVAFLSADSHDEDRFWAENRLMDFGSILVGNNMKWSGAQRFP